MSSPAHAGRARASVGTLFQLKGSLEAVGVWVFLDGACLGGLGDGVQEPEWAAPGS